MQSTPHSAPRTPRSPAYAARQSHSTRLTVSQKLSVQNPIEINWLQKHPPYRDVPSPPPSHMRASPCAALTTSWRPLTRAPSRTASHSTASRLHSRARMFPSFPPRHASTRASTVSFSAARAASSASAAAFAACSAATAFDGPAGVTVLGAGARGVGRGFAAGFACV